MASDAAGITDELGVQVNGEEHGVEVKGPDPEVWPAEPADALPEDQAPEDPASEADGLVKLADPDVWGEPDPEE